MNSNNYSTEEVNEFRQIILEKLASAREEFNILQESLKKHKASRGEGGSIKLDDSAEVVERETFNNLAGRQVKFIKHLEMALDRINRGTYGICRITGTLIDKDRLRLVPHTTHSVEAKEQKA